MRSRGGLDAVLLRSPPPVPRTPSRTLDITDGVSRDPFDAVQRSGTRTRREGSLFVGTPAAPGRGLVAAGPSTDAVVRAGDEFHHTRGVVAAPRRPFGASSLLLSVQRSDDGVVECLTSIAAEAAAQLLRRLLHRWRCWATRRTAAGALRRRNDARAAMSTAQRYFDAWRGAAVASLAWATRYEAALRLEWRNAQPLLLDSLQRWQTVAARRAVLSAMAAALLRETLLSHARAHFSRWRRRRRRGAAVAFLSRAVAESALAVGRRAFVTWQAVALRRALAASVLRRVTVGVAASFLDRWRQYAQRRRRLRLLQEACLWQAARRAFRHWADVQARRDRAWRLQLANTRRQLAPVFLEWAWQAQLRLLQYDRFALTNGLPDM